MGRGEDSGPSGTRRAPVSQTRGWLREAGAPHPAWAAVRGQADGQHERMDWVPAGRAANGGHRGGVGAAARARRVALCGESSIGQMSMFR